MNLDVDVLYCLHKKFLFHTWKKMLQFCNKYSLNEKLPNDELLFNVNVWDCAGFVNTLSLILHFQAGLSSELLYEHLQYRYKYREEERSTI